MLCIEKSIEAMEKSIETMEQSMKTFENSMKTLGKSMNSMEKELTKTMEESVSSALGKFWLQKSARYIISEQIARQIAQDRNQQRTSAILFFPAIGWIQVLNAGFSQYYLA